MFHRIEGSISLGKSTKYRCVPKQPGCSSVYISSTSCNLTCVLCFWIESADARPAALLFLLFPRITCLLISFRVVGSTLSMFDETMNGIWHNKPEAGIIDSPISTSWHVFFCLLEVVKGWFGFREGGESRTKKGMMCPSLLRRLRGWTAANPCSHSVVPSFYCLPL